MDVTQEPTLDEVAALNMAMMGGTQNVMATLPEGTQMGTWSGCEGTVGSTPEESLDCEMTFLQKTGREPSNEEVLEYIEKHRLQEFLSDVIMCVARYVPPDPFEFMLNHLEGMVAKHRSTHGIASAANPKLGGKLINPVDIDAPPPDLPPEERGRIVRCLATVLQSEQTAQAAASKRLAQFGTRGEGGLKMTKEGFAKLLDHVQEQWGLQAEDTKLMAGWLQRWRFRANAAAGMRGMPLWPMSGEDFISAWPSVLRSVRDRYVPIGGRVNRSLFIRKAAGEVSDKYTLGQSLGRGAFGEVLLVTHKETKQRRVCKRVARVRQKVSQEQLMTEVDLLRRMDHPHIIRLFEYFESEEYLDMIMEPVFGGTLTHLLGGIWCDASGKPTGCRPAFLKEGWVATLLSQLFGALTYAHEVVGVIHKDLKTDNVLLVGAPYLGAEEQVRQPVHAMLADFGIAEIFSANRLVHSGTDNWSAEAFGWGAGGESANVSVTAKRRGMRSSLVGGTPSYMSPEMFAGSFTEKCDIWSMGVIMFQILTGELPYRGENLLMQGNMVCNPRRHPPWDLVSKYKWSLGARWCCQQLLCKDEGMRPSAAIAQRDTWLTKASAEHTNVKPAPGEVQAMQKQHLQSHLMKMSLSCVAAQLNLSQLHYLNLRFKKYDISGDGRLSHVEMRQALEDVGVASGADAELIIESLDADHSGMIEYSEFVAGCLDLAKDGIREQLRIAFEVFDLDGNGTISLDELRQVLTAGTNEDLAPRRPPVGSPAATLEAIEESSGGASVLPDGKTAEEVMRDLDTNGSDTVDYHEFEAYLLKEHARIGQEMEGKFPTLAQSSEHGDGSAPSERPRVAPRAPRAAAPLRAISPQLAAPPVHPSPQRRPGGMEPATAPPEE